MHLQEKSSLCYSASEPFEQRSASSRYFWKGKGTKENIVESHRLAKQNGKRLVPWIRVVPQVARETGRNEE